MDKKEALARFVKENVGILNSEKATSDLVKKLRKKFYEKHGKERYELRSGTMFRLEEIAEEVSKLIVAQKKPTIEQFIEIAGQIPFLNEKIPHAKLELIFAENTKIRESVLTSSDLSKINQDEYLKEIERRFNERAKQRAEQELANQRDEIRKMRVELEQEKKEIERFRSELDLLPESASLELLEEYVESPAEENVLEQKLPWWEMLNLDGNPFPSTLGLGEIPTSKFSEIVVNTHFIKNYLDIITKKPEELLGKNILIIGEYGSGKTTLFDFLRYKAGNSRILPIKMTLSVIPAGESLINGMLHQIYDNISETYKIRKEYDPRREKITGDLQIRIATLLNELQNDGTEGFLILIDGLNKEEEFIDRVFQFLRYLQNIQELLSSRSVRVGFLVAGAERWKKDIIEIPSLSGTFYSVDEIPPITENEAIEAFRKRLSSFTKDGKAPPQVREGSLKQAFRVIKQRKGNVTFRSFLTDIRDRLLAYEFDDVGLQVDIQFETVDAVHLYFQKTQMAKNFSKINAELKSNEILRKACNRVVFNIYKSGSKGVIESNPLFKNNKGAFYLLRNYGFISQVRASQEAPFKWYLSQEYRYAITDICENLKIDVVDALSSTFEESLVLREKESMTIYSSALTALNEKILAWIDSYPFVAKKLGYAFDTLSEITMMSQNVKHQLTVKHIIEPIFNLIDAINSILNGKEIDPEKRWASFKNSWACPENISPIERFINWNRGFPEDETKIYGILQDHNQVVLDLLLLLSDLTIGEGITRLSNRRLSLYEFHQLHSIRLQFHNLNYKNAIDKSRELAESAIRNNMYHALRAVWGDQYQKAIPSDIQKSLDGLTSRGDPRIKRDPDINFLYDVSRSEYSKILLDHIVYSAIFSDILNKYDKQKLTNFLSLIFSLGDRKAHEDRTSYFSLHASEIRDAIQSLPWFLEVLHNVVFKFISECKFEYEIVNSGIEAKFLEGVAQNFKPRKIDIDDKEARKILIYYLEFLSARNITIDSLESVCSKPNTEPEAQIAILRIISETSLINIKSEPNSLPTMSITSKGEQRLIDITKKDEKQ